MAKPICLALGFAGLLAGPVAAQPLTAVVLQGPSQGSAVAQARTPATLVLGVRVQASNRTWTELAFSDGSSVVLEPGADFTLQSVHRGPDGITTMRGAASRGRLRLSASDRVIFALAAVGAEVRIVASSAVVLAGATGSATLISGREVVVSRNGSDDTLRRPGFAIAFSDGGPQRQSRQQLASTIDSFAPVVNARNTQTRGNGAMQVAEAMTEKMGAEPLRFTVTDPNAGAATVFITTPAQGGTSVATGPGTVSQPGPIGTLVDPGPTTSVPPGTQVVSNQPPTITPNTTNPNPPTTNLPPSPPSNPPVSNPPVEPPPPAPIVRTPYSPGTQFANNLIGGGAPNPNVIAAPGQDNIVAGIDNTGHVYTSGTTTETNESVTGLTYQNFGSVRVRRMPADAAGTGRLGTGITDSAYQNILAKPLPEITKTTGSSGTTTTIPADAPAVYDMTARAGYMGQTVAVSGASGFQSRYGVAIADSNSPSITNSSFGSLVTFPAITVINLTNPQTQSSTILQGSQTPVALGQNAAEPGLLLYIGPSVQAQANADVTPPPSVYIIDKVTAGVPARGIQANERYFAIGGTPVGNQLQYAMPANGGTLPAGTVSRFGISDGLNPTAAGGLNTTQDLPAQFATLNTSATANAFTANNAFRPESTFPGPGLPRGDTHLYAVAGDGTAARPNTAMRADLQILPDGSSTGAVSVGGFVRGNGSTQPLVLAGQTIGSTRLAPGQAALSINSNLGSLATGDDGQSAHLLGATSLNNGQISYFAVSQADPRIGSASTGNSATATTTPAAVQPGLIGPLNDGTSEQFAYTRLATNVGTTMVQNQNAVTLQGFGAAMVERQGAGGGIYSQSSAALGDVQITRAANANTFSATIKLQPTSAGQPASDPLSSASSVAARSASLTLGDTGTPGATPNSAWVSGSTFAAVGPNQAMVSVDGSLLQGIPNAAPAITHPLTGATIAGADLPASNDHVAWGYFLGDLATSPTAMADRTNLGFWVAGRQVDASVVQTLSGTATYAGGMIGTAADGAGLRTVAGRFAQTWDFGNRSGSLNANFDGRSWTGVNLGMPAGSGTFAGTGVAGDRALTVQGAFFHAGTLTGGALPAAVGGSFGIFSPTYGANGIFVGSKR